MISLIDIDGHRRYLAAGSIARVMEAGPGACKYGINAYVRTTDGRLIEACQTAAKITAAINKEKGSENDA